MLVLTCALDPVQVKATAAQRRRLKALHWDKIRAPQAGTVWSQAAGQQLKLDFDQLESLFQARCPACFAWRTFAWPDTP